MNATLERTRKPNRTKPNSISFRVDDNEKEIIDNVKAKTNLTLTEIFLLGIKTIELEQNNN